MRIVSYLAVFEPTNNGGYGVRFPEVPGCVAVGKDIEDARSCAEIALITYLHNLLADGKHLPVQAKNLVCMQSSPDQFTNVLSVAISISKKRKGEKP